MPQETQTAVNWALHQQYQVDPGVTANVFDIYKDMASALVDTVRDYFNTNNITYSTFSYIDLEPYL